MKQRLLRLLAAVVPCVSAAADRPNILWITSEDHGPQMGCYGDRQAATPHVDALARKGLTYTRAWSCAPVCAPARTTLISGLFPPSAGAEHMRSMVPYPAGKKMYPQLLREAGYYCTNNAKEDYNLAKPGEVWDESSRQAHWKNRPPGRPFFAVFNSEKSHESKVRVRPHTAVHDPARIRVPAYHPDTPEVRRDWAQYYDIVGEADADAGRRLREIDEAGLAEDTIIFYYADHGPGMPRSKRWPSNSGLQVPLVVFIPGKFKDLRPPGYKAGGKTDRLVSFVDFAPTLCSLAGIRPPDWLQGHAFLGSYIEPPQAFIHGFRGRMDERCDLVRSVTDGRFVYLRNYMPHLSQGQHVHYQFQTPTTAVWRRLYDEGKLTDAQTLFWKTPRAPEELYDLETDPDEVRNLADLPEHRETLRRLRQAQQAHAREIRDTGFLPEGEIHSRSEGSTPYDMARDPKKYPYQRIAATAELASMLKPEALPELRKAMTDPDSAVRYWGAMGVLMRGSGATKEAAPDLRKALSDPSPYVRITAASALAQHAGGDDAKEALAVLGAHASSDRAGFFPAMASLTAIDNLGPKAATLLPLVRDLRERGRPERDSGGTGGRYGNYIPRLIEHILGGQSEGSLPGKRKSARSPVRADDDEDPQFVGIPR